MTRPLSVKKSGRLPLFLNPENMHKVMLIYIYI